MNNYLSGDKSTRSHKNTITFLGDQLQLQKLVARPYFFRKQNFSLTFYKKKKKYKQPKTLTIAVIIHVCTVGNSKEYFILTYHTLVKWKKKTGLLKIYLLFENIVFKWMNRTLNTTT